MIPAIHTPCANVQHLMNLPLADPCFTEPGNVDIIIGADLYGQLLEGPIRKGPVNSPVAQLTQLGWIISGPCDITSASHQVSSYHCSIDQELNELVERFWHQEEIASSSIKLLSPSGQQCEDHFSSTHSRDITGRYIVHLPFEKPIEQLGDSKPASLRMMKSLQQKFENNPAYCQIYSSFLREYEHLQHMIKVPEAEFEPRTVFYLPHHGVLRDSSSTTKLRVVFNGLCRAVGGSSLNEILHTGTKLQVDLFDVLIWFRKHKYIFSSDIEKMYRQIKVHPDDWDFQRILWKENQQSVKYQLTTVTYGLACAPFLALRSILQLIQDEGSKFPLAVDTLTKGRYVDDVFVGATTVEGAQQTADQVNQLCMAGGFPLKKWIRNHPDILKFIPSENRVTTTSVHIKDTVVHALGLLWNPSSDSLHFNWSPSIPAPICKRVVLSQIAQLFDPLGLLYPVLIKFKIFMQELWTIKLGWDDQLASSQLLTWQHLQQLLDGLENIRIPRWIGTEPQAKTEIHGFCDASQLAMAAAIYIRTESSIDEVNVSLLCSKTKVAPLKRMTIPRLELSAAVMLTKIVAHCRQVLHLQETRCYLWTDSSIVYLWLNSHPSRWKDFVHNRACFIQETLPHAQWKHISGKIKPADCATRGSSAMELQDHTIWWTGPSWLSENSSTWPNCLPSTKQSNQDTEQRPTSVPVCLHINGSPESCDLLNRYSSLPRLFRITAMCKRMTQILLGKALTSLRDPLTPSELNDAANYWIKITQKEYFQREITILLNKQELPTSLALLRLLPFIDAQGLLRVGGRLKHSSLVYTTKHPYILPKNSTLTTLIICDAHDKTLHGSTQDTLNFIRQHHWIVGGRAPVRSFILKCVKCTRYRRAQTQQLIGQLPASRVNPARPFLHSGVDYAGPFDLKTWKGRTARSYKSWIALFIYHSTSAVHLEIVTDYSTDAFLAAYKRFTSRRGNCATLNSDCGTNFKEADKEL